MSARPDTSNLFENIIQQAMKGQDNKWWQSYHYPNTVKFNPEELIGCARSALYSKALKNGTVYEEKRIIYNIDKRLSNISRFLSNKLNARLVYKKVYSTSNILFYIFDDGAVNISFNDDLLIIEALSLDESKVNSIYNITHE